MSPKTAAALTALLATSACPYNNADLNYDELHKYCSQEWKPDLGTVPPDLAMPPPAKCAAAKGLAGDALICVDFDKVSGLSDQALKDWNFNGNCIAGWEINGGKLQVKNFGGFVGTCSFTMPLTDLAAAANQKYQSVTLAVVQKLDVNDATNKQQSAQIYLGVAVPANRLSFASGANPRQTNSFAVSRTDLVTLRGDAAFQPLFQLTSAAAVGGLFSGVQIESIAVMGNP